MIQNSQQRHFSKEFAFWAVVLILAWGGVPVLSKLGSTNLNGFEMTFWINLFALPIVVLWVLPKAHRQNLSHYSISTLLKLTAVGFLGSLLYQVLYFSSYQTITAITGTLLGRLSSVLFVSASIIFLKERHSKAYLVALLLASIGSVLSVAEPGGTLELSITIGFWLMVLANISTTGYSFANNAIKRKYPDANANLLIFKASTLIVIGGWAIIANLGFVHVDKMFSINLSPDAAELYVPFVIGVFADGIGFLAYLKLLNLTDSVKTTLVNAIVAVVQVFLAIVIYRETATFINAVVAPALVIIPIAVAGYLDARSQSRHQPRSNVPTAFQE